MVKARKCAVCYVAEYHQERRREGDSETKGIFTVFEEI